MARSIDFLITYRIIKLLVTPFERQEAFKYGIIDKDGNVLRKSKTLKTEKERNSYTLLHRFIFNLKRILAKVGLKGKIGTFAVALGMLIKEDKQYEQHKEMIERTVIQYLKDQNLYEEMLNEVREMPDINEEPYMTCFGIDLYEQDGELVTEYDYAKTL